MLGRRVETRACHKLSLASLSVSSFHSITTWLGIHIILIVLPGSNSCWSLKRAVVMRYMLSLGGNFWRTKSWSDTRSWTYSLTCVMVLRLQCTFGWGKISQWMWARGGLQSLALMYLGRSTSKPFCLKARRFSTSREWRIPLCQTWYWCSLVGGVQHSVEVWLMDYHFLK